MRDLKFLAMLTVVVSMVLAGCSGEVRAVKDVWQTIEVQKRVGDEDSNNYEVLKVVSDMEQVNKVEKLLDDAAWENAEVSMVRRADYRFSFPNPEAKVVLYELWVGPQKNIVELVINGEGRYVKLGINESAELFEILTGESLADF